MQPSGPTVTASPAGMPVRMLLSDGVAPVRSILARRPAPLVLATRNWARPDAWRPTAVSAVAVARATLPRGVTVGDPPEVGVLVPPMASRSMLPPGVLAVRMAT